MPRLIAILVLILLHIYALSAALTTDRSLNPGRLPRLAWAVITLLPLVGPVVWIVFNIAQGLESKRINLGGWQNKSNPGASKFSYSDLNLPRFYRQKAPDDDEEFLRELGEKTRSVSSVSSDDSLKTRFEEKGTNKNQENQTSPTAPSNVDSTASIAGEENKNISTNDVSDSDVEENSDTDRKDLD